jgi:hypothetical protein
VTQLVACTVWNREVVSSNLASLTNFNNNNKITMTTLLVIIVLSLIGKKEFKDYTLKDKLALITIAFCLDLITAFVAIMIVI